MSDELTNDCVLPETFPQRPNNRPSLPHVRYRIGEYGDFREFLLRRISLAPELQNWTHHGADDPGIALLEGAAVVGDILTFYQEHYANEAYLRTAQWRESVSQLVRLLGYRLRPGLGGSGRFAFEVKGAAPVAIPASYPLKADLDEVKDTVDFETAAALTAYPYLSRFALYRARQYSPGLAAATTTVEIASAGGSPSFASLAAIGLKAGEKLMLVADEPSWTRTSTTSLTQQHAPQLVKIKTVTAVLGRWIVELEGTLRESWSGNITAFRLNRTFRHYGATAPAKRHTSHVASSGLIDGMVESSTAFLRHLSGSCSETSSSMDLGADFVPLDQEVSDLTPDTTLLWQAPVTYGSAEYDLILARKIAHVAAGPIAFGDQQGSSTFVTLDAPLVTNDAPATAYTDIRQIRLHEATSPALTLRRLSSHPTGEFSGVDELSFYGTAAEAAVLPGRILLFQANDGRTAEATVQQVMPASGLADADAGMRTVVLSALLSDFVRDDFDESAPTVAVFGNVVVATQGKSQPEAVLGNGDNRQTFQTFKLPKSPLTYFNSATATPAEVPELTVSVERRAWTQVDSFFGRGPQEEIYLVRQDEKGDSYVQFGDGLTGARLPSGIKNVSAVFRAGASAHGSLKPDAKVQPGTRIVNLDKIQLPGVIAGGADPESGARARQAAPGKLQSLGRIVSLSDYEAETLALAGVTKASAIWDLTFGLPAVVLTVLLAAGRADEYSAVKNAILAAQRGRGANRDAVVVRQAFLRYVFVDLSCAIDPALSPDDVEDQVRVALGLIAAAGSDSDPTGLFALGDRKLGDAEYATQIEGVVQNVPGVIWCKVTALGLLGSPATAVADPGDLTLPAEPRPLATFAACLPNELLQLDARHLSISAVTA